MVNSTILAIIRANPTGILINNKINYINGERTSNTCIYFISLSTSSNIIIKWNIHNLAETGTMVLTMKVGTLNIK